MKCRFVLAIIADFSIKAFATHNLPKQTQVPTIDRREYVILMSYVANNPQQCYSEAGEYILRFPRKQLLLLHPPELEDVGTRIGVWTQYLTGAGETASWIGPDPSHISVVTTTTKDANGVHVTSTVNQAVEIVKGADGSYDILLSPAFRKKLEPLLKDVPPCAKKRLRERAGPSCGLEEAMRRISESDQFRDFQQLQMEVNQVADLNSDSGYGTDEDGFSEGAEGPPGSEAGDTAENLMYGTGEDAGAIGAIVGEGAAVDGTLLVGGFTLFPATFLAALMHDLHKDGKLDSAYHIPPKDIHTVTKSKKPKSTTTAKSTTTSASCPTGLPDCEDGCQATRVATSKPTDIVEWACSEGKNKDCKCNPKSDVSIHPFQKDWDDAILAAIERLKSPAKVETSCSDDLTNVPSKFLEQLAGGFCGSNDFFDNKNKDVTVDVYGGLLGRLERRTLMRRTPPEDRDNYKSFAFHLTWTPKEQKCLTEKENICTESYKKLVRSQCGTNHPSDRMTANAKIDVGCGEFTWKVYSPPPELDKQKCHDEHKHTDVRDDLQDSWTQIGCTKYKNDKMKVGDKPINWVVPFGYNMKYRISWKDSCHHAEQSIENPAPGETCYSLLRQNYKACNNGGAGGYRDAGCIRYEFWVDG
ncbi:hypothetical protein F53441_7078 [Fusarium austroafricanum]|uniref:Uncharacterized protein n=1 Tax=Fusarium austroafricanum TaxID=2364996 RepID=A0A8H4KHB4_9HYPO|nr:hypothetical protein F53441_7078 [Fusarium austroafricanum]